MNDRLKFRWFDEDLRGYKYFKIGEEAPTNDCLSDEWEQCVGLKDKNGKLIYECDIVELKTPEGDDILCEVNWHPNECAFNLYEINGSRYFGFNHLRGLDIKVIGNIQENKEFFFK